MTHVALSRPRMSAGLPAKWSLPFALPILATFALLFLVGNQWPRDIAIGSGLKIPGLCVAALSAFVIWWWSVRQIQERRIRTFAAIFCGVTGIMGWPVWTVGILPSVNGSVLTQPSHVPMTLERVEMTPKSKSRGFYHWAYLKTTNSNSAIQSGRYFISEDVYQRFDSTKSAVVDVTVAQGLLGAYVVLGYE